MKLIYSYYIHIHTYLLALALIGDQWTYGSIKQLYSARIFAPTEILQRHLQSNIRQEKIIESQSYSTSNSISSDRLGVVLKCVYNFIEGHLHHWSVTHKKYIALDRKLFMSCGNFFEEYLSISIKKQSVSHRYYLYFNNRHFFIN